LLKAFFILAAGLALGIGSADALLRQGSPFGVVAVGAWRFATGDGTADADPYARAALARVGEIPLALGEGLRLTARVDDDGAKLNPACVYVVGPRAPPARYWTLEIADRDGYPMNNPAGRSVFRSGELLRAGTGEFAIRVSAEAEPGNWLPIGRREGFQLILRLYDTPLSAVGDDIQRSAAPHVTKERCR